jgi:hypothetical protein
MNVVDDEDVTNSHCGRHRVVTAPGETRGT